MQPGPNVGCNAESTAHLQVSLYACRHATWGQLLVSPLYRLVRLSTKSRVHTTGRFSLRFLAACHSNNKEIRRSYFNGFWGCWGSQSCWMCTADQRRSSWSFSALRARGLGHHCCISLLATPRSVRQWPCWSLHPVYGGTLLVQPCGNVGRYLNSFGDAE